MSMATRNDDRVSSARLLDVLKGLQESRHLGSEPEVETETVEKTKTEVDSQYPTSGSYATSQDFYNALLDATEEPETPIYALNSSFSRYVINIGQININDYTDLDIVYDTLDNKIEDSNLGTIYIQSGYDSIDNYSGKILYKENGKWICALNDYSRGPSTDISASVYVYITTDTTTYTESTTTKTKHTIKQDYVPNADWTQNDPDGEGYVQGRTHWVEIGETEFPADQISSVFKPFGFKIGDGGEALEYRPSYEAVAIEYNGAPGYLLAEDQNGEQETQFQGMFYKGIIILDGTSFGEDVVSLLMWDGSQVGYGTLPYTSVYGIGEVVHKLDRKFYEYIDKTTLQSKLNYLTSVEYDHNGIGSGFNIAEYTQTDYEVSVINRNSYGWGLRPGKFNNALDVLNDDKNSIVLKSLLAKYNAQNTANAIEILTTRLIAVKIHHDGLATTLAVDKVEFEQTGNLEVHAKIYVTYQNNKIQLSLKTGSSTYGYEAQFSGLPNELNSYITSIVFTVNTSKRGGISTSPTSQMLLDFITYYLSGGANGNLLFLPDFNWALVNLTLSQSSGARTIIESNAMAAWITSSSDSLPRIGFGFIPYLGRFVTISAVANSDKTNVTLTYTELDGSEITLPSDNKTHYGLGFVCEFPD